MTEPSKNDKFTHFDWMIAIIGFLTVACLCLTFKACSPPELNTAGNKPVKAEINAAVAQKQYDDLLIVSAHQMDSLELIVAESKKKSGKVVIRYKTLRDTIFLTPADSQQRITKMLCPATGDSVNLQEINYCLANGKQSEELYKNSLTENSALKEEVKIQTGLVIEGGKNMAAKDTLIGTYRTINEDLNKAFQKQKRKTATWRTISVVVIAILIPFIIF